MRVVKRTNFFQGAEQRCLFWHVPVLYVMKYMHITCILIYHHVPTMYSNVFKWIFGVSLATLKCKRCSFLTWLANPSPGPWRSPLRGWRGPLLPFFAAGFTTLHLALQKRFGNYWCSNHSLMRTNHKQSDNPMASLCFLPCGSLWRYTGAGWNTVSVKKNTMFIEFCGKNKKRPALEKSSAKNETTSFFDLRTSETVWPEPRGCQGPASRISFYISNNHLKE